MLALDPSKSSVAGPDAAYGPTAGIARYGEVESTRRPGEKVPAYGARDISSPLSRVAPLFFAPNHFEEPVMAGVPKPSSSASVHAARAQEELRRLPSGLLTCSMCQADSTGLWFAAPHVRACIGHVRMCCCGGGDQSDKALCAGCIEKIDRTHCRACGTELWHCPYCRGEIASWCRTDATMCLAALGAQIQVTVPAKDASTLGIEAGSYLVPMRLGSSSCTLGHLWDLFDLETTAATTRAPRTYGESRAAYAYGAAVPPPWGYADGPPRHWTGAQVLLPPPSHYRPPLLLSTGATFSAGTDG